MITITGHLPAIPYRLGAVRYDQFMPEDDNRVASLTRARLGDRPWFDDPQFLAALTVGYWPGLGSCLPREE